MGRTLTAPSRKPPHRKVRRFFYFPGLLSAYTAILTCIIYNPTARGEKAARFRQALNAFGAGCRVKPTDGPNAASRLAAEAVHDGCTTIVAAGGDGTLNEVLNGIAGVPGALERVRFGVLPLGTVNVFARELSVPSSLPKAWEVIERGSERVIDLPHARFAKDGKDARRFFMQLAGAGLDSRAIGLTDYEMKKRVGPLAYVVAGLRALQGKQPAVRVTAAGKFFEGPLVLVGNGRFYGGPFTLFPGAAYDDGLVDVCLFRNVHALGLFRVLAGVALRQMPRIAGTIHLRVASLELQSLAPVQLQLDGENAALLPCRIAIEHRLRVLVP